MSSYEQIIHNALVLAGRPDGYSRAFDQHRRAPRFPLLVPFRFAEGSYPLQSLPEALSSRRANQSRLTFAYCHEGKAFLRTFHHEYASIPQWIPTKFQRGKKVCVMTSFCQIGRIRFCDRVFHGFVKLSSCSAVLLLIAFNCGES